LREIHFHHGLALVTTFRYREQLIAVAINCNVLQYREIAVGSTIAMAIAVGSTIAIDIAKFHRRFLGRISQILW
jgi:hypothetical protein